MAFNLATALLSDPIHLASFKKEATYDDASAFIAEAAALYPKCPKWAQLTAALDKDSGKWVSGGALKCAREIHHILGKKVAARQEAKAEAKAAEPTVTDIATQAAEAIQVPEEAEAPASPEAKVAASNPVEVDEVEQSRQVKIKAKAAPKAKAPKAKARK